MKEHVRRAEFIPPDETAVWFLAARHSYILDAAWESSKWELSNSKLQGMSNDQGETTRLLLEACQGQRASLEALLPLVYDELKAIAAQKLRGERRDHTLQPTALVHEAFLRLVDQTRVHWQGRAHFCAVAASMMRRILVDHARAKAAEKRGAGRRGLPLLETIGIAKERNPVDIVALDDLLAELARLNERHARVVELRFFGGLNVEETAHTLGVSPATVKNDWRAARAWLLAQLSNDTPR